MAGPHPILTPRTGGHPKRLAREAEGGFLRLGRRAVEWQGQAAMSSKGRGSKPGGLARPSGRPENGPVGLACQQRAQGIIRRPIAKQHVHGVEAWGGRMGEALSARGGERV